MHGSTCETTVISTLAAIRKPLSGFQYGMIPDTNIKIVDSHSFPSLPGEKHCYFRCGLNVTLRTPHRPNKIMIKSEELAHCHKGVMGSGGKSPRIVIHGTR